MAGDLTAVPRLLTATGISQIIVRHDLVRGMPGRTFADDRILTAALEQTPGMSRVVEGDLDLWYLDDGSLPTVHAFDRVIEAPARPTAGSSAIGSMPSNIAITARDADPGIESIAKDPGGAVWTDDVVNWPIPAVDDPAEAATTVPLAGGTYTVAQRARSAPALVPTVRTTPTGGELVLSDPTSISIDGKTASSRPDLVLPVPTPDIVGVSAGTRTVFLDSWQRDTLPGTTPGNPRPNYLPIGSATEITAWAPSATPARPEEPSAVYDCNNYEPRPASELNLRLDKERTADGPVLRLSADDHAACTQITVPDAAPGRTYRVRMEFRTVEGKRPEVCLWQIGTDGCDLVPRAPINDEWIPFDELVTVDDVAEGLQVVLYANVGVRNELRTVTEYRNVTIDALDPVMEETVFPPEVPETTVTLEPGQHTLSVVGGQSGSALEGFGPLENCYNTRQMTFEEAGLTKTELTDQPAPAFQLTAQFDRACIAAPVPDMGASSMYELSFEGRSVSLRNPSICLYQRGPDRCSKTPAGGPWKDWSPYRAFVGPDPNAVETRLYLFGPRDLDGKAKATVEYRSVKLRPVAAPVDLVLVRDGETAPPAIGHLGTQERGHLRCPGQRSDAGSDRAAGHLPRPERDLRARLAGAVRDGHRQGRPSGTAGMDERLAGD